MNEKKKPSPTRRLIVVVAGAMFAAFVVLTAGFGVNYCRARAALNAEIAAVAARGEPVWFSDLQSDPHDPAVKRGRELLAAIEAVPPLPADFPSLYNGEPLPVPSDCAKLRAVLDQGRDAVAEVLVVLDQGDCRLSYEFQTGNPFDTLLPYADKASDLRRWLLADGLEALAGDDGDRALGRVTHLLNMAEVLRHDPFFVSQLIQVRHAESGLDLLEVVLRYVTPSADALLLLDDRLKLSSERLQLAAAVAGERAGILTAIEQLGTSRMGEILGAMWVLDDDGGSPLARGANWKNRWWGSALYAPHRMHQQLFVLQQFGRFAELIDRPDAGTASQVAKLDREFGENRGELPICRLFVPSFAPVYEAVARHRARLVAARFALAVCGYRSAHDRMPASLNAIAPRLGELRNSPFFVDDLCFETTDEGFAIFHNVADQRVNAFTVKSMPPAAMSTGTEARPE